MHLGTTLVRVLSALSHRALKQGVEMSCVSTMEGESKAGLVPLASETSELTIFNPFTAPACEMSGLKSEQTGQQTKYFPVLRRYNKSTFDTVRFDRNPLSVKRERKEGKKGFNFAILLVVFK